MGRPRRQRCSGCGGCSRERADDARRPQQRMAAQLAELDAALLRFSTRRQPARRATPSASTPRAGSTPPRDALATPIETPDVSRAASSACAAPTSPARSRRSRAATAAMLDALAWRGTEARARAGALAARAEMSRSRRAQVARAIPGAALPAASTSASPTRDADAARRATSSPARAASQRASVRAARDARRRRRPSAPAPHAPPASADAGEPGLPTPSTTRAGACRRRSHALLQPLETLHQPTGALYRLYTDAAPATPARRRPTSATARTGSTSAARRSTSASRSTSRSTRRCRRSRRRPRPATPAARTSAARSASARSEDAGQPRRPSRCSKRAVVRMAAIAIIDIASGRIEALAGALSPCTRQEYDGPGPRRRRATSACRIRSATVPTRCSIPPSSTTRCRRR